MSRRAIPMPAAPTTVDAPAFGKPADCLMPAALQSGNVGDYKGVDNFRRPPETRR